MATFENYDIFSTYSFSYTQGYKATLRGGYKLGYNCAKWFPLGPARSIISTGWVFFTPLHLLTLQPITHPE